MKTKPKSSKQQNIRLGSNLLEKIRSSATGQALVEAIVALSLLIVGFLAVVSLLNNSLSTSSTTSNQVIATYLAGEGIEVVKNLVGANILSHKSFNDKFQEGSYEVEADTALGDPNPGRLISPLLTLSNTRLKFDPSDPASGYTYGGSGAPTHFRRTIQVLPPMGDRLHIVSIVEWDTKGGGTSEIKLEDFFFPQ